MLENNLIGLQLDGYTVVAMTEVYRTNDDGVKSSTMGYFKDSEIASAWAQNRTDKNYIRTIEILAITNGQRYFIFGGQEIPVHDDEQAVFEVRKTALAKLTEEEKAILGL